MLFQSIEKISAFLLVFSFVLPLSKERTHIGLFPKKNGEPSFILTNDSPETIFAWNGFFFPDGIAWNTLTLILLVFLWPVSFLLFSSNPDRPFISFMRAVAALFINVIACYLFILFYFLGGGSIPLPGAYVYFLGAGLLAVASLYEAGKAIKLFFVRAKNP